MLIMNPCNIITVGTMDDKPVKSSGSTATLAGDASFTVRKKITQPGTAWQINVQVLWAGSSTGVSETRLVIRQSDYQDNANCAITRNVSL
jgi:hypothetical protein